MALVVFFWFMVAIITSASVSRMLRGAGYTAIVDVVVGTIFGMGGGAVLRLLVYNHASTSHMFGVLMFDYIFALTGVMLMNVLPFTGASKPLEWKLPPHGPVKAGVNTEQIKKAF